MCGIVGYVGKDKGREVVIRGLEILEYRGYDSAGICEYDGEFEIIKTRGKVKELEKILKKKKKVSLSLGHTRWATHGTPSSENAHPHSVGEVTIVHNGIIENYEQLKSDLIDKGYSFKGETDTEIAASYIDLIYKQTRDILLTLQKVNIIFEGSYAIGIIINNEVDCLYAIRRNAPLVIGIGQEENFIASDIIAIIEYTNKYLLLENNYIAKISKNDINIFDENLVVINPKVHISDKEHEMNDKAGYDHYMLKEINQQGDVIAKTISKYFDGEKINLGIDLAKYDEIIIVGCGSAMYVGEIAKNLFQKELGIKTRVEIASEFRYNKPIFNKNDLVLVISQSGETADTLAALELANESGVDTLAVVNVSGSSIDRITKYSIHTQAGTEIAVATTKALIAQISVIGLMFIDYKIKKEMVTNQEALVFLKELTNLETNIIEIINDPKILSIANDIKKEKNVFFLGRGLDFAICLEGSLKLKEISYIHSEAYPSGELKHGSIALVEKGTKIIAIITQKDLLDKSISNIEEVISRGADVSLFILNKLDVNNNLFKSVIDIKKINIISDIILTIVNLQVLSYHVAKLLNCEIDQPKNLAKSVTVE